MTEDQTNLIIDSGLNKQWNEEYRKAANRLARNVLSLRKEDVTDKKIKSLHKLAKSLFPKAIAITKLDIPTINITLGENE